MRSPRRARVFLLAFLSTAPLHAQDERETVRLMRSTYHLLTLEDGIREYAIADSGILQIVPRTANELLLLGTDIGRTSLIVWLESGQMRHLHVLVERDLSVLDEALRTIHESLRAEMAPDRDAVVLRGLVPDVTHREAAERAALAYLSSRATRGSGLRGLPLVRKAQEGTELPAPATEPNVRVDEEDLETSSSQVINLVQVETLPERLEGRLDQALRGIAGPDLRVRRVQRGTLPDDENDVFVLEGHVRDQVTLVRVLTLASRLVLGRAAGEEDIEVLADEGGALTDDQGLDQASQGLQLFGAGAGVPGLQGGGSGGGGNGGLGQSLVNRVSRNIARATAIEIGGGRLLSFVRVRDVPQVQVRVRLYEVNRSRLRSYGANLTTLVSDFPQPRLLPATGATAVQGQDAARVGGFSNTDVQNVLSFLGGRVSEQVQLSGENAAVDAAFSLLASQGLARTLTETTLTALSGELAAFQVGGQVPVPASFAPAFGDAQNLGVFQSVFFQSFGIQIGVRPIVGENDVITMDVVPQVIAPDPGLTSTIRDTTGTNLPTTAFESRSLRTSSRIRDGHALLLGGLLDRTGTDDGAGTPLLEDIPLLGWLFRSVEQSEEDLDFVLVVSPTILREPPEDLGLWIHPELDELRRSAGLPVRMHGPAGRSSAEEERPAREPQEAIQ